MPFAALLDQSVTVTGHHTILSVTTRRMFRRAGHFNIHKGKDKNMKNFGGETWRKETNWKAKAQMGG